jgi:hypothetical protein
MAGGDGDTLAGSMRIGVGAATGGRRGTTGKEGNLYPEERERKAKEESLRLSKARIEWQLGRATNPAHRAMLERALSALDAEITLNALSQ